MTTSNENFTLKYQIPKHPQVDATFLVEEMERVFIELPAEEIPVYIKFRYGLLPSMYYSSKTSSNENPVMVVLYLVITMRDHNTTSCLVSSSLSFSYPNFDSSSLAGSKLGHSIEEQQEDIFDVEISNKKEKQKGRDLLNGYLEDNKTFISIREFHETLKDVAGKPDTKFFNYVYKMDLQDNFVDSRIMRSYFKNSIKIVHPEVFKVMKYLEPYQSLVANESVKTTKLSSYKNPEQVYSSIMGVAPLSKIIKKAKGSSGNIEAANDPFLEKTLLTDVTTKPLYFLSTRKTNELKKNLGYEVPYDDPEFPFSNYENEMFGHQRYEMIKSMRAYPYSVWQEFYKTETEINGVQGYCSVSPISFYEEITLHVFAQAYSYSVDMGLTEHTKSSSYAPVLLETLHNDINKAAQVLVSIAKQFTPKIMHKKMNIKTNVYKKHINQKELKNTKAEIIAKSLKGGDLIHWERFAVCSDNQIPMLLGLMNTEAISLVADHHDHVDQILKNSILNTQDNNIISKYSIIYTKFKAPTKYGPYSAKHTRYPFIPKTLGFGAWQAKQIKENRQITEEAFVQDTIFLEEAVTSNEIKKAIKDRMVEVARAKSQISRLNKFSAEKINPALIEESATNPNSPRHIKLVSINSQIQRYILKLKNIKKNSRTRTSNDHLSIQVANETAFYTELAKYISNSTLASLSVRGTLTPSEAESIQPFYVHEGLKKVFYEVVLKHTLSTQRKGLELRQQDLGKSFDQFTDEDKEGLGAWYIRYNRTAWIHLLEKYCSNIIKFNCTGIDIFPYSMKVCSTEDTMNLVSKLLSTKLLSTKLQEAATGDPTIYKDILDDLTEVLDNGLVRNFTPNAEVTTQDFDAINRVISEVLTKSDDIKFAPKVDKKSLSAAFKVHALNVSDDELEAMGVSREEYTRQYQPWLLAKEKRNDYAKTYYHNRKGQRA